MGHEDRDLIPKASEEAVDMTVDLGDFEVGMAILYENVRNDLDGVPRAANLVPLRGPRSSSRSATRSPGNRSWVNRISVRSVSWRK